ncbi:AAA family ATPase [Streptomyces sp. MK5]|uniref:AAA family ATPase n=1 Tax=Streptomyces sp. MK5 TaxID=3064253 RepID=UPI002741A4E9|nr:AAA family ATPase [Streptomyces sp. MK5]
MSAVAATLSHEVSRVTDNRPRVKATHDGGPMLTRLEVPGFKNLLDLSIDFGPFTCIAGENGTGKSNVFDAIQFLSLLADRSMMEAAQEVRGGTWRAPRRPEGSLLEGIRVRAASHAVRCRDDRSTGDRGRLRAGGQTNDLLPALRAGDRLPGPLRVGPLR